MIRSVCAAIIAASCLFATGAFAAPGKPLTDADKAEAQVFVDTYAQPIMRDMNAAIALASTDTPGACKLIKATLAKADEMDGRVRAFRDRLASEGKTTDGADTLVDSMPKLKDGLQMTAKPICDGSLAHSGNAQQDALVARLQKLTATMTTEMNAFIDADQRNDRAEACRHLALADGAQKDLVAMLLDIRSKIPDGTPDAAQLDAVIAKVQPYREQVKVASERCPTKP